MPGRVLVVDDIETNIIVLETLLTADYYHVIPARSGEEALARVASDQPDIILLDVMMPGMDGFEVCRRLKSDPAAMHIPVVMVTALDQIRDRIAGLEAGADDFLTKPIDNTALFARVRNLIRTKELTDEWRARVGAAEDLSWAMEPFDVSLELARILLVVDDAGLVTEVRQGLDGCLDMALALTPEAAADLAREGDYDLMILSLSLRQADGLRICSQIRASGGTRQLPILVLSDPSDRSRLARALDMGVNDYVTFPIEPRELLARTRSQIRRKRYQDRLCRRVEQTFQAAITDPLTGLSNRRHLETEAEVMLRKAKGEGPVLSLMIADIDHFKSINDTYGHSTGDAVLKELGTFLKRNSRANDLVVRLGGEEFVVVMPNTDLSVAERIAGRLRERVKEHAFPVNDDAGRPLGITVSVGLTSTAPGRQDDLNTLLERADEALYDAKRAGRDRVIAWAA